MHLTALLMMLFTFFALFTVISALPVAEDEVMTSPNELVVNTTSLVSDNHWPAFTTYSKKGCHGEDQIYDFKHTVPAHKCQKAENGYHSLHVFQPSHIRDCYVYLSRTDDCSRAACNRHKLKRWDWDLGYCNQPPTDGVLMHSFWWDCSDGNPTPCQNT